MWSPSSFDQIQIPEDIKQLLVRIITESSDSKLNNARGYLRLVSFIRKGSRLLETLVFYENIVILENILFERFPTRFPKIRRLIEYGHGISIAEGQYLQAIQRLLLNSVSIPELCR